MKPKLLLKKCFNGDRFGFGGDNESEYNEGVLLFDS